jgi:hypothetical protein
MSKDSRCVHVVFRNWHDHHCERKGVVEHNGKLYCKQHSPQAREARAKASDERWQAKHQKWVSDRLLGEAKEAALALVREMAAPDSDSVEWGQASAWHVRAKEIVAKLEGGQKA